MSKKIITCSNCGKNGHEKKNCYEPIISYGIINIKLDVDNDIKQKIKNKFITKHRSVLKIISERDKIDSCTNNGKMVCCYYKNGLNLIKNNTTYSNIYWNNEEDINKYTYFKDRIKFLMIKRKHSLGFLEFIRGRYDVWDMNKIIDLFRQMTQDEITNIRENEFDVLVNNIFNQNDEDIDEFLGKIYVDKKFGCDYTEGKRKFELLKNPDVSNGMYGLNYYTSQIKPKWKNSEWGFPKGRRLNSSEQDIFCACREFEEETGYTSTEYDILNIIEPIEENLTGTNNVDYKHVYYVSLDNSLKTTEDKKYDYIETGELKWITFDELKHYIRNYHNDRIKIATYIYILLINNLIHL